MTTTTPVPQDGIAPSLKSLHHIKRKIGQARASSFPNLSESLNDETMLKYHPIYNSVPGKSFSKSLMLEMLKFLFLQIINCQIYQQVNAKIQNTSKCSLEFFNRNNVKLNYCIRLVIMFTWYETDWKYLAINCSKSLQKSETVSKCGWTLGLRQRNLL